MNESEKILSELAQLREVITHRLDSIEKRLDSYEASSRVASKRARRQQASIEELQKKVEELSQTSAVWRNRDLREIGIDRETAYDAFREMNYRPTDALRLLEEAGILRRGGNHLTKAVRKGDRIIRAVVIMEG